MYSAVWIEITRSWIDACVVRRSEVVRCHRHWRAEENTPNHSLASDIAAALQSITQKPGRVRVLWSAPGAPVDLRPVPVPGEPGLRAVRLAHAAAAGLIPDIDALSATPMATDGALQQDGGPLALASGMSGALLSEIAAAVKRAGGTLAGVYAAQATVLADTAASALAMESGRLAVSVSIGEDASAIAIVADRRIVLARTVDLGAAALRHSYEHILRDAGRIDTDTTARSVNTLADELLYSFGVPARAEELPHDISGDIVFQMMRPALQRLVFEVKQSIRFTTLDTVSTGDGRESRALLRLVRTPIPHLAAIIAHECDAVDASDEIERSSGPGAGLRAAVGDPGSLVLLHMPTCQGAQRTMRLRIAACAGLAGAIGLISTDAWTARSRALQLEQESSALQGQVAQVGATDAREVRIWEASKNATTLMSRQLAPVAPWAGCMAAIASELGPGVTLTKVTGDRNGERSLVRFDGEVTAGTPAQARDTLVQAMTRLRALPLFVEVDIPNIDQESHQGGAVIAFSLVATLREAPPTWLSEVLQ